ncbi:MAG: hypothetical protein FIO03_07550 [Nitrosopumilales archaeon]|nr:hypothetical protein [Nitrosopumilales archaeon]
MTIKNEAINFYGTLKGMIGIQNRLSMDNAFEGEKGTLGLIDPHAVLYGATEIGNNKNLAYEFTPKRNNIALVCDGSRVQN